MPALHSQHSHLYQTPDNRYHPFNDVHMQEPQQLAPPSQILIFHADRRESYTYTQFCKYEKHIMRNKCFKYPSFHSPCMEMYVFCRCAWRWCTGGLADDGLTVYCCCRRAYVQSFIWIEAFAMKTTQTSSQGSPVCLFININFRHINATKFTHNIYVLR